MRAASTATGGPIWLLAAMDRSSRAVLAAVAIIAVSACSVAGPPGAGTPAVGGEATAAGQTPGSDQASDAGSETMPDPCTLLTPDELKTQLDIDFQPGVLDPIHAESGLGGFLQAYCTWNPQQSDTYRSVTLIIHPTGSDAPANFEAGRTLGDTKPAPGVGDDAYLIIGSGPGTNFAVAFKKGPWYLDLTMSGADWQPSETQLTELAELAAARL